MTMVIQLGLEGIAVESREDKVATETLRLPPIVTRRVESRVGCRDRAKGAVDAEVCAKIRRPQVGVRGESAAAGGTSQGVSAVAGRLREEEEEAERDIFNLKLSSYHALSGPKAGNSNCSILVFH